ncbi:MAG: NAD-dependent epimerase/dehydratase family protein [Gemmatimonadota bacterium]
MTAPKREPRHVLVAGCGYVGGSLASLLAEAGDRVTGLKRNPDGLPRGVEPLAADVVVPASLGGVPKHPDAVVYAVSPAERSGAAYRNAYVAGLANALSACATPGKPFRGRLILVSSTGVYGESSGAWVDEETPPDPADETGAALLEGETLARTFGGTGIVLRLGGIYGPGRDRTVRRVASGDANCPEPDLFGNRIHRDDAAAAALHLLSLDGPDEVYLGVDRDPAPLRDVYRWIAGRLQLPDPCAQDAAASGTARRRANKRCSSDRLMASGFVFRYPTFREGYTPFIEAIVAGR